MSESDIKYKIVVDDEELISKFSEHESLADKSAKGIESSYSKSFDKISKETGSFHKESKGLFSSLTSAVGSIAKPIAIAAGSMGLLAASFVDTKKTANENLMNVADGFKSLSSTLLTTGNQFISLFTLVKPFMSLMREIGPLLTTSNLGIFGLGIKAGEAGTVLSQMQFTLLAFNSALSQTLQVVLGVTSVISALVGVLITELISGVGKAISWIGDKLVEASIKAAETFSKLSSQTIIMTAVIGGVNRAFSRTDPIEEYVGLVNDLSTTFNLSTLSLQKATQELVLVGANLGYTKDQTKNLIKVVAQYAKINHEDVYDAAVAFGSALNGNSQSVLKYGIKLTAANNQHYLFKQGSEQLFDKLTDEQKALVRLSNLFEQFGTVQGVAKTAADSMGDSVNRTNVLIERLSTVYGEGAAVVENFYLKNVILNTIFENLNFNLIKVGGFIGALSGRIFQILGFLTEWSIKTFLIVKGIQILQTLLKSNFWMEFGSKTLPIINNSLFGLINGLAGTEVKITSLGSAIRALGLIAKVQFATVIGGFVGVSASAVTVGTVFSAIGAKFATWFGAIARFISPLLPLFAQWALIIGAVVAAFYVLKKAFDAIEEETKLFTTLWEILKTEMEAISPIIENIKTLFIDAFQTIMGWAGKALGFIIYSINGLIAPILYMAELFGKKFISPESLAKLKDLRAKLNGMNESLYAANFSLDAFGKRVIASTEEVHKSVTISMEDIISLAKELENTGKTQLQILEETHRKRLNLITEGLKQELITSQRFNQLKKLVDTDYLTKRNEEIKNKLQSFNEVMKKIRDDNSINELEKLKQDSANRIQIIQNAANQQLITQDQANKALLQNQDYYNQELRKLMINQESTWSQLGDAIKDEFKNIGFTMQDIAKDIKQGLINGIGASFQWLGRSLAEHSSNWKDLQKNIGNILAGMASMLGNFFIAVGMGMTATGPILGLSGGAAIAAGVALHVLAGVLGTMGGDATGTPTAGASAGDQSLGPDLNQMPTKPDQAQRQEPQNVLNVTINGDVLDSDESSMRIVKLINEAYDKKGVVLRQGAFA